MTPMIYVCATLWHETEKEMNQVLKSLFRSVGWFTSLLVFVVAVAVAVVAVVVTVVVAVAVVVVVFSNKLFW